MAVPERTSCVVITLRKKLLCVFADSELSDAGRLLTVIEALGIQARRVLLGPYEQSELAFLVIFDSYLE